MNRGMRVLIYGGGLLLAVSLVLTAAVGIRPKKIPAPVAENEMAAEPTPEPTVTPTPTPRPLTLEEMNQRYGPCAKLPVLMYHHVEDMVQAKAEGHSYLAVAPETFTTQVEYMKNKGYQPVRLQQLLDFFRTGTGLPAKPVMLTFDDGYEDFYTYAWPVLRQYDWRAVMFVPTGLVNNPGYLSWDQISQMGDRVEFANHTWSHYYLKGNTEAIEKEIDTAQTQLEEKGLGRPKAFAYPYGYASQTDIQVLTGKGFELAFTTQSGSILCAKKALTLPRIRIGNTGLGAYGM